MILKKLIDINFYISICMGSRVSISNEDDYINDINNINENQLDLSNMDNLQIKAIKQISKEKMIKSCIACLP